MEQINLCEFSDMLRFAEQNHGIFYNKAHDLFVKADKFSGQIYVEEIKHELLNYRDKLDENQIMVYTVIVEFAKYHSSKRRTIKEFYIAPKNW